MSIGSLSRGIHRLLILLVRSLLIGLLGIYRSLRLSPSRVCRHILYLIIESSLDESLEQG